MRFLEKQHALFEEGGKLERFYPIFEAAETFFFSTDEVTEHASHVRDAADLKRIMMTVVFALIPCMLMAMYNTGYQAHLAIEGGAEPLANWRTSVMEALGLAFASGSILANFVHGALYYIPVYIVTLAVGGTIEVIFAVVRKHDIAEGFLVSSALFPLILPATIPLWQVGLGIAFGVFVGKEIFGGVGMNIWNPALTARAFLYFAYPKEITGDGIWIAAETSPDAYSGATWLAIGKEYGFEGIIEGVEGVTTQTITWWQSFIGFIPGSMGETSALFCIFGAAVLILTQVGSWRIMLSMLLGTIATVLVFNGVGHLAGYEQDHVFSVPFYWHLTLGGFAFATVFMATDPVSAPYTEKGKFVYGALIGFLGIAIRNLNPAFAGSWMLAILFMNMFSPLIDHFIVQANIKRRLARNAA